MYKLVPFHPTQGGPTLILFFNHTHRRTEGVREPHHQKCKCPSSYYATPSPAHVPAMPSATAAVRPSSPFPSLSSHRTRRRRAAASGGVIRCAGLRDLIGGDLIKPDLGRWLEDVEKHKALAVYPPHEGGYEGRYLNRLRYKGYRFLDLTARGLGDPETTLTKIHPVCPPHLGRQPIARWYFPPEVDYRLSLLPPDAKGLVVWIIEAKVLSKAELQFLALLPTLRPKVKVIAECGNWRKFVWKPLREIAGLPSVAE